MSTEQREESIPPAVPQWVVGTATGGTVGIATGAFWLSFTSLADLASRAGIPPEEAWVWPLIIDGIVVVSTTSVVALTPHGPRATIYPWILLTAGTAISVAANSAHALVAADTTIAPALAAAVAAMPPLVQLAMTHLTVELTRRTRPSLPPKKGADETVLDGVKSASTTPAPTRREKTPATELRERALSYREQKWSNSRIARELGVHPSTVGRWFGATSPRKLAPLLDAQSRTSSKSQSRGL